ncbi:MAG: CPBP family intramembrane glutamic endopeptidase [Pseudomonadota bacterium]
MTSSKTFTPQYGALALIFFTLAPAVLVLLAKGAAAQGLSQVGGIAATSAYLFAEVAILAGFMAMIAKRDQAGAWINAVGYQRRQSLIAFLIVLAVATAYAIYFRDIFRWPALNAFSQQVREAVAFWPPEFLQRPPRAFPLDESAGSATLIASYSLLILAFGGASAFQTLYFRGVILPRMDRLGWLAPFANTALFVVYHLSSPWFWPQFFIFTLMWGVLAFATRSVWAVMLSHVIFNTYWFAGQILTELSLR